MNAVSNSSGTDSTHYSRSPVSQPGAEQEDRFKGKCLEFKLPWAPLMLESDLLLSRQSSLFWRCVRLKGKNLPLCRRRKNFIYPQIGGGIRFHKSTEHTNRRTWPTKSHTGVYKKMSTEMATKVETFCARRTSGSPRRLPRECSRKIWHCSRKCTRKCARSIFTCSIFTWATAFLIKQGKNIQAPLLFKTL